APRLVGYVARGGASHEVAVRLAGRPQATRLGIRLEFRVRNVDVLSGAAILRPDDHVLGDIDQPPREIARVGRAQSSVRETLAGAVGRDEVLEHAQPLLEGGLDWTFDDLALGVSH